MQKSVLVTTVAVLTAFALPSAAQQAGQPRQTPPVAPQGTDRTPPADTERGTTAPGPASPRSEGTPYAMPASGGPENPSGGAARAAQPGGGSGGSSAAMAARPMDYGMWESSWGPRPPAPPTGFANPSDWHRHVRACQQRYKTYDPATDMYVPRVGSTARCTR